MISPDPILICLPICYGLSALCCCIGGDRIPGGDSKNELLFIFINRYIDSHAGRS